ncbi:MAG TPA: aminomethyl-transferring glycine dehydrogenase [Phycisphaerales bacterium]|nr:aminomethyl-transferring glycine dehydrogenase [Phycisphaerales bacterium]HMP36124.1 aminomethyl-transferring glycine dehydrogenase [Phycisphaerales bacterium]
MPTLERDLPTVGVASSPAPDLAAAVDPFAPRHLGPSDEEIAEMLATLGFDSLDALTDQALPASIRLPAPLKLEGLERAGGEHETLSRLRGIAARNQVFRSFIGMGYHDTIVPPVIQRNILENPGWYTQYTPYQAEIAQGRLEALINFQTMVSDLCGLPLAGASLLDEATAAAEAMAMCHALAGAEHGRDEFLVAADCHPQTIAVVRARAEALRLRVTVAAPESFAATLGSAAKVFGILLQYPTTDGRIEDYRELVDRAHAAGALAVVATDLLALTRLVPPGEFGADCAVGSAQRFGVPMGFGGPHAAFMATRTEYVRRTPGRLIGVSRDAHGNPAYRMAIQTREQHIRRDRATSNICTAQVLLAIMAGMYAVWHGPEGLRRIGDRVHRMTAGLADALRALGHECGDRPFFDTLAVRIGRHLDAESVHAAAHARRINFRRMEPGERGVDGVVGVSLDEATTPEDLRAILECFGASELKAAALVEHEVLRGEPVLGIFARQSGYLAHPVFRTHHSEHEMLRYIFRLQGRDLSLAQSMIPLGSCTMKLNATSEMIPVTWPEFSRMHPFAPREQVEGYRQLFADLESWLAAITGFAAVSLQPNAGSQGEYAGLLVIRAYHRSRGDEHRDVCLIPVSAHGTNPASAVMAGMRVVSVRCDELGNVDVDDLCARAAEHRDRLAALMITYPSTHGVFEERIREICAVVHQHGGQVYMDGANMNAQVGLTSPGFIGADVCHLNLHKTFCIPHGGGGPGMGPIGVAAHLAPFLPGHPVAAPESAGAQAIGPVSAAPYGSASILPISWMYIAMMGAEGLTRATQVAILAANYMARRLAGAYDIVYANRHGLVAHEFILDCRPFDADAEIKVDDLAKRLMDYGFHAPTMSWPVPGTLMIEPTESEPKAELDRLCDALIAIRAEIRAIAEGRADRQDNVLKGAPHTAAAVSADVWTHPYARSEAAYPAPWTREAKFWPPVGRVDNPYGDRNLVCTCPPMEAYGS